MKFAILARMGYNTDFSGSVKIDPPLNAAEVDYLKRFANSRRMARAKGPYFVDGSGFMGQDNDPDIWDYNTPPAGQPGLWCQWEPSDDGSEIAWNWEEKFYNATEWMAYLIDHFLKPGAEASKVDDPQFEKFTFDHVVNGTIEAQGEEPKDIWKILVEDNEVRKVRATSTWPND